MTKQKPNNRLYSQWFGRKQNKSPLYVNVKSVIGNIDRLLHLGFVKNLVYDTDIHGFYEPYHHAFNNDEHKTYLFGDPNGRFLILFENFVVNDRGIVNTKKFVTNPKITVRSEQK